MASIAYLSLGSNIGDRELNLRTAIERLRSVGEVETVSSIYETEPMDFTEQPWFLNCAVKITTERAANELLDGVLAIERLMGRERVQPKAPRNIDIDVLLYDDAVIDSEGLKVPHPRLAERMFVLAPLAEIAPEVRHPLFGKTIAELRDAGGARGAVRVVR